MNHRLIKRSILFLAAAGLALYILAFYRPVSREISVLQRDIAAMEEGMTELYTKAEEVTQLRTAVFAQQTALKHERQRLPLQLESSDIISLLAAIDQGIGVKHSLLFLAPVPGEDFITLPVRISLQTNLQGYQEMLRILEELPVRLTLSNMQFSSSQNGKNILDPMDETDKVLYNLHVEMTLNFYVACPITKD